MNELLSYELILSCIIFLVGVVLISSWKDKNQAGGNKDTYESVCASPDACDLGKAKLVGNNCGIYNYLKHDDDCPGNDMMTRDSNGNLIPIEYNKNTQGVNCCNLLNKCEELCNNNPNCVGFSYNGDRCLLKSARCENEVKNGFQFYKKPGSPDSMPNIRPPPMPVIRYQNFKGDCPGNDIQAFNNITLDQCKQRCTQDPRCRGLSYHPQTGKCYTKYATCPFPGINFYGFNFHKKT